MLGAYGNPDKTTLKLDQLAAEGMRFDRAYGSPVCTPTRLSLYAGLYPTRHGYTGVIPVPGGTQRFVDFKSQFPTYAQQLPDRLPDFRHCVTGGKTTLDHGGTHLPLLMRWPGTIEPGAVAKNIIDVADFSPPSANSPEWKFRTRSTSTAFLSLVGFYETNRPRENTPSSPTREEPRFLMGTDE